MLTAAQCATYNESKKLWMWITGGGDDFATHLGSSMITGLVTTTATGPVDVIKTNMFVGEGPGIHSLLLHACLSCTALAPVQLLSENCILISPHIDFAFHDRYPGSMT